ncbi:hypothetical protein AAFF_G00184680 [Aldrovandia affinis]|uniref:Uncharacterized protein n=1 Tax=Aldrovandia affinis TaxID=143900 RepID=A0AAD7RJU2_9TELE|nr:hypothetical protein AAFF_G00184680 [Aldrovandia affinis]
MSCHVLLVRVQEQVYLTWEDARALHQTQAQCVGQPESQHSVSNIGRRSSPEPSIKLRLSVWDSQSHSTSPQAGTSSQIRLNDLPRTASPASSVPPGRTTRMSTVRRSRRLWDRQAHGHLALITVRQCSVTRRVRDTAAGFTGVGARPSSVMDEGFVQNVLMDACKAGNCLGPPDR